MVTAKTKGYRATTRNVSICCGILLVEQYSLVISPFSTISEFHCDPNTVTLIQGQFYGQFGTLFLNFYLRLTIFTYFSLKNAM